MANLPSSISQLELSYRLARGMGFACLLPSHRQTGCILLPGLHTHADKHKSIVFLHAFRPLYEFLLLFPLALIRPSLNPLQSPESHCIAMDPLSVSSREVGLLAFTMQMAKVAGQVQQAVVLFEPAPRDLTDLLQRLSLLLTMCKLVEVKVGGAPDAQLGGISSVSLGAISTALLQCQNKMDDLSRTLAAIGLDPSQDKSSLSRAEASSRLRFVPRREEVRSMVQDVDHVTSLLHILLAVDTR